MDSGGKQNGQSFSIAHDLVAIGSLENLISFCAARSTLRINLANVMRASPHKHLLLTLSSYNFIRYPSFSPSFPILQVQALSLVRQCLIAVHDASFALFLCSSLFHVIFFVLFLTTILLLLLRSQLFALYSLTRVAHYS